MSYVNWHKWFWKWKSPAVCLLQKPEAQESHTVGLCPEVWEPGELTVWLPVIFPRPEDWELRCPRVGEGASAPEERENSPFPHVCFTQALGRLDSAHPLGGSALPSLRIQTLISFGDIWFIPRLWAPVLISSGDSCSLPSVASDAHLIWRQLFSTQPTGSNAHLIHLETPAQTHPEQWFASYLGAWLPSQFDTYYQPSGDIFKH